MEEIGGGIMGAMEGLEKRLWKTKRPSRSDGAANERWGGRRRLM